MHECCSVVCHLNVFISGITTFSHSYMRGQPVVIYTEGVHLSWRYAFWFQLWLESKAYYHWFNVNLFHCRDNLTYVCRGSLIGVYDIMYRYSPPQYLHFLSCHSCSIAMDTLKHSMIALLVGEFLENTLAFLVFVSLTLLCVWSVL